MNLFDQWAKAKPYIEAALEHAKGTHTIDDVALMVGSGHLKLWVGEKFAMLTEFNLFPRLRVLNVFAAGGELTELQGMEKALIDYAKESGCTRITANGRDGWLKALPGAEKLGTMIYRDI